MIFDETTLQKLNTLAFIATKVRAGVLKGERRSTKRGTSIEFADYRDYVPGDDLRRLDWNVYARLDRPFIKLLEEEEDLAVHVLLDASRSMEWGEDGLNKFTYARQLTAALSTIALATGDRLTVKVLRATDRNLQFGPARGQHNLMRLLEYLQAQEAAGQTDLNQALRNYALTALRPGLAVLISDMFSPNGYEDGFTQLLSRGYEVILIHLLSPDELDPPLAGDLQLVDVETGATQDVSLDGAIRRGYRQRLQTWQGEIQAYCNRRGIHYLQRSTDIPWDKFVLSDLRRAGVVK
ncbi:MAG: DUF58 domain-containing protein [Anaerolineales bacterium]|nr:DUF58 domain-containing protein [Anaerolineales bacterium]